VEKQEESVPTDFKQFQHGKQLQTIPTQRKTFPPHTTNDPPPMTHHQRHTTNDTPRTLFRIQFSFARKSGGQLQYFRRRLAHAFIVRLESG